MHACVYNSVYGLCNTHCVCHTVDDRNAMIRLEFKQALRLIHADCCLTSSRDLISKAAQAVTLLG